jgi:hypothetical protein
MAPRLAPSSGGRTRQCSHRKATTLPECALTLTTPDRAFGCRTIEWTNIQLDKHGDRSHAARLSHSPVSTPARPPQTATATALSILLGTAINTITEPQSSTIEPIQMIAGHTHQSSTTRLPGGVRPHETILVACSKCDWRAAFAREELIAAHGADYAMPICSIASPHPTVQSSVLLGIAAACITSSRSNEPGDRPTAQMLENKDPNRHLRTQFVFIDTQAFARRPCGERIQCDL